MHERAAAECAEHGGADSHAYAGEASEHLASDEPTAEEPAWREQATAQIEEIKRSMAARMRCLEKEADAAVDARRKASKRTGDATKKLRLSLVKLDTASRTLARAQEQV